MWKIIEDLVLLSDFLEKNRKINDQVDIFKRKSKCYLEDFYKELPEMMETNAYSFVTVAWLIRMYYKLEMFLSNSKVINSESEFTEEDWIKMKEFVEQTLQAIYSPEKVQGRDPNEEIDLYKYKLVLTGLETLSLSYEQQKVFYREQEQELSFRLDIPSEVYWDYVNAFYVLSSLIEKGLFCNKAIAWFIRTYEQVKKCMELEDAYDEEVFANHPESDKAREYARITLNYINPDDLEKIS